MDRRKLSPVELVIIGALAVGLVGCRERVRLGPGLKREVFSMFGEIKQKEEAYRAEFSEYQSSKPGATEADLWPPLLGAGAGEPRPKSFEPVPSGWKALGLTPGKPQLWCGYVVIAGWPRQMPTGPMGVAAFPVPPTTEWWYAVAQCDVDGNGPPNATFVAPFDRDTLYQQTPLN